MGTIVRCARCDNALIRVGRGPGRYWLDMRGVRCLQVEEV
jgi:phage FluMu protein Com